MRRREFITLLGGAAVWPRVAHAQQRAGVIGVIINYAENDPEGQKRFSALRKQRRKLGWVEGSKIRIEVRWAAGKTDLMRAYASELVGFPADTLSPTAPRCSLPSICARSQSRSYSPRWLIQRAAAL